MRTSRLLALLTVLLLAFGATACGDDDDPAEAEPATEEPATESGEDTAAAGSSITIAGFAFDPEAIEVEAGASVTVTNDDSAPHTWTADDGGWDSGQLGTGDTFEQTFAEAGTFAYHCEIHPTMTGTVVVG